MDLESAMTGMQEAVERRLVRHLDAMVEEGRHYHPQIEDLYLTIREFIMRPGKRIASSATLMTYFGYGGPLDDDILDICVGIEMYRHAILIHDDLVDEDGWRRGGETVHRSLAEGLDSRFGEGASVFAGNGLLARAYRTVLASGFETEKVIEVIDHLSSDYLRVNESQVLDLLFEYKVPDVEEWEVMASRRAASLFEANVLVGAILADAPEDDLHLLRETARSIGYAFDIQDDIIDLLADEDDYGRPSGGDIVRGKKPLHMVIGLGREPGLIDLIERAADSREEAVMEVREALLQSGAIDEARGVCIEHVSNASSCIIQTSMSGEAKAFFGALLDLISGSLDWYSK